MANGFTRIFQKNFWPKIGINRCVLKIFYPFGTLKILTQNSCSAPGKPKCTHFYVICYFLKKMLQNKFLFAIGTMYHFDFIEYRLSRITRNDLSLKHQYITSCSPLYNKSKIIIYLKSLKLF